MSTPDGSTVRHDVIGPATWTKGATTAAPPTSLMTVTTSTSSVHVDVERAACINECQGLPVDVVTMPILTWLSPKSGPRTVRCVSNSTEDVKCGHEAKLPIFITYNRVPLEYAKLLVPGNSRIATRTGSSSRNR